jgi:hypothetical protein
MASKYDRVNPWEEKLKRLYNCNRLVAEDQKYLNYQFERYKLRSFHIVSLCGGGMFAIGCIPIVKQATPFKYWTSVIVTAFAAYKWMTARNNQHYE